MLRVPLGIVLDHGVESNEELAHAGGEDDLGGLSGLAEAFGEGVDGGVVPACGQCGHVEDAAYGSASAFDGAFAAKGTTVAVEGGESYEGSDLRPVEFAELWKFGDEGGGSLRTDSRHGLEEFKLAFPVIVGFDELANLAIEALNLFLDDVEDCVNTTSHGGGTSLSETIGLGGAEFNDLASTTDEEIKFELFFRGFLERSRLNVMGVSGDDGSIEAIGFGEDTDGLGEVSHGPGVDDGDNMTGVNEGSDEVEFVATRGFEHDQALAWGRQRGEQVAVSAVGVGKRRGGGPSGKLGDVQSVLGDVDTEEDRDRRHASIPSLQMRARSPGRRTALAAVRAIVARPAPIQLSHGLRGPEGYRSGAGR